MKTVKEQVIQITLVTFIWLLVLISLGWGDTLLSVGYVWRLLGIAGLFGGLFGGFYPYVWSYLTWSSLVSSLVMTVANFSVGFISLALFSRDLFIFVWSYWWLVLIVTFILHLLMYQVYRQLENQKLAKELNQITKKSSR
ncbi:hypothetical protein [uncultured Enterococcus sp.]|uniref:hypothetical protein n=1 Tax=uncultured Enterococcus sp. TaxID=167972 RepID=UPI0025F3106A|nr:hypothetical protein [uncultured Enterococcus sp.]